MAHSVSSKENISKKKQRNKLLIINAVVWALIIIGVAWLFPEQDLLLPSLMGWVGCNLLIGIYSKNKK